MLTSEAIKHFGNMSQVAQVLGVSRTAVWKWHHLKNGHIPADFAAQLHVLTGGKLAFNVKQYGTRAA